jgi:flagellar basal-body rod protein FlgF/flagellar basal-body rod protein FlgG
MDSGLYAACAGLVARTQALDLAANNLANVNTSGYKAQLPTFRSVLASASNAASSPVAQAVNDFGVLGDSRTDLLQGSLDHTGSDFDFALQGQGWFTVQSGTNRLYTRNGNFHVDSNGRLVTGDGNPVLGTQGPIIVPPGKLYVSGDGTVSVDGALAGQLQLVQFSSGTVLTAEGSSYVSAPSTSEQPSSAQVVQGSLENSNVSAISAAVDLVSLQRHYDLLQQALTTFQSNFNRIAAQNLPQI